VDASWTDSTTAQVLPAQIQRFRLNANKERHHEAEAASAWVINAHQVAYANFIYLSTRCQQKTSEWLVVGNFFRPFLEGLFVI
jgi:hypothetical protein